MLNQLVAPNITSVYLDNQSTTSVDQLVLNAMLPYLTMQYGNPSSENEFGMVAKMAINEARDNVANLINAFAADEVYFTSGATEAINWAIRGVIEKADKNKNHIIISSIEHSAVLKICEFLQQTQNIEITKIRPSKDGIVNISDIENAIRPETIMVSIMHVNNEIGTIQPIEKIGEICKKKGVVFFVDAAQSIGKIECDVQKLHIDLLAASGHKIYGPKGIGFLYISDKVKELINPLLYGGGQENGFRPGTQNVPFIVAIGEACKICKNVMKEESVMILDLRNEFIEIIQNRIPDIIINGSMNYRIPGNINFSVPGINNDILINNLQNIFISKGSACNSMKRAESHVLQSVCENIDTINSAIRVGIGRFNTKDQIQFAANKIATTIEEIRISNEQF